MWNLHVNNGSRPRSFTTPQDCCLLSYPDCVSIQSSFRELRDTLFVTITYELRIKLIGTDQKTCYESHILQGFGVNYSKQLTLAWIL